ncbi:MAG: ActS/PrrB/RegB family redox-sensitive histidine kinase [Rhodobacteraceae bacterium]|nr:ActS/PrrB/RegB family redox-sensitive histidine kinase [Paracoccaceae bacterium]
MSEPDLSVFTAAERSAWLKLRTLILLRWLAVFGQSAAVLVAWLGLGLDLPLVACGLAIGASALFNLVAKRVAPENRRLSEREAVLTLLFDLCQLGFLLFLTGGLANPFALLMLAPVTISASVLSARATTLLAAAATAIITALVLRQEPLRLTSGVELTSPPVLIVGAWASLAIGIVFLAIYARRVTGETFLMSQALTATQMALDREQRITALGGVVAAAAHELGTPLATIKLVSTELAEELADRPEQREDALLIRAQADRCRDILRAMGPRGKEDAHVLTAPLSSVVEEAAAPHADRGARIITRIDGAPVEDGPARQPEIARRPEIIQGLRNLVQNAVDFARTTVWIDMDWTPSELRVVIGDDGPGYPSDLIGRIGDPFVRRRGPQKERPGYEGMGLGLFIAKTLLERSGAELSFGNGSARPVEAQLAGPPEFSRPTGAVVAVTWPRARAGAAARGPLGRNAQL